MAWQLVKKYWRVTVLILISIVLTVYGYTMMRGSNAEPLEVVTDLYDSGEWPEGGRLEHIEFRHICRADLHQLDVSFRLRPGQTSGAFHIGFPFQPQFKVDASKVEITRAPNTPNQIIVRYDSKSDTVYNLAITITMPDPMSAQLGAMAFRLPVGNTFPSKGISVGYSLYYPSDATVTVSGSKGVETEDVVGLKWENLQNGTVSTTASFTAPFLLKRSQESLAIGAILVSAGINLLTGIFLSLLPLFPKTKADENKASELPPTSSGHSPP